MELRELKESNWEECVNLWTEEDIYIASNLYSIAEAQFYPKALSRAVYDDVKMVGYVMFGEDDDDDSLFIIDRLLIGKEYRNRGYASQVIQMLIKMAREKGSYKKIQSSTEVDNLNMIKTFIKNGFNTEQEMDGNEIIYFYTL